MTLATAADSVPSPLHVRRPDGNIAPPHTTEKAPLQPRCLDPCPTMPIRNPFRRAGAADTADDPQRPSSAAASSAAAKPIQITDPAEYKLCGTSGCPSHSAPDVMAYVHRC